MYRRDEPVRHPPPPFGPPPPHGPPFRLSGPCSVPPPGHLPARPCGPYPASALDYRHSRPPSGHFVSPHCSRFSIDRSTAIASGGSQQIITPAQPPQHPVPQWNPPSVEHHPQDNSDLAGEEFLRCIAANKPFPDYLKGNMAYNLAEALKSASILKEAVKSDREFQKHVTRSKSRSRSRSRGRSRAKSRARSKSRVRSRSRGRSKSRARGKSRAKSRARSRSWSESRSEKKSLIRSKSRARRSKSRSSSSEKSRDKDKKRNRSPGLSTVGSSNRLPGNSLLEGLKLVMSSQDLEDRLPSLKDAILSIKAQDESKKVECVSDVPTHMEHEAQDSLSLLERESMLLPHERVGGDFSWLQGKSEEESSDQKANEFEDEESFLYGDEALSQIKENAKLKEVNSPLSTRFGHLVDPKQSMQLASSTFVHSSPDNMECEKIKTILKSLGSSNEIKLKTQGQNEQKDPFPAFISSDKTAASLALPALNNPNVRQALESLQSLIKATKEKRTKSDGTCQASDKYKAGDSEERKREKLDKISKMESLAKDLDELLKEDGLSFLTSVIGFYCHKCEEFIGDFNSAENHAAIHHHSNSIKEQMDMHAKDSKGHLHLYSPSRNQHSNPPDRSDQRDYGNHRDSGNHQSSKDHQQNLPKITEDYRSKYQEDSHRSQGKSKKENIFFKEEMKKERMLITLSRGLPPPPPNIRVKEEADKEQATMSHGKESMKKSSKEKKGGSEKDKNSDSTDDEVKSPKTKRSKKKKKKKEKKKKKDKDKS